MANKLLLKRSSVALKVPLATDLDVGELAVNLTDQKLYSKKPDGTVILVGSGLGGAGDVQGPVSSTDNAIAVFDGTNGKVIKNSQLLITTAGSLSFQTTGARILGDFTSSTHANRVMFQTSTANSASVVGVIPNGTSTTSAWRAFASSNVTNSAFAEILHDGSTAFFRSNALGSGTASQLIIAVGSIGAISIPTTGEVRVNSTGNRSIGVLSVSDTTTTSDWQQNGNVTYFTNYSTQPMILRVNGAEQVRIRSDARVGIGTTNIRGNIDLVDSFYISPIGGFYTDVVHNAYYDNGWRSRNGGPGSILQVRGGTNMASSWSFQVSSNPTSTAAGGLLTVIEALTINNSGVLFSVPVYNNTSGATANMGVDSSGQFFRSTSSRRYKKNIADAWFGLPELMKLRPVTYETTSSIDEGQKFGGLIAEEVDDAGLAEFVERNASGEPDALRYANMVSLCVKAIQQQQEIIQDLQSKIAEITGGAND